MPILTTKIDCRSDAFQVNAHAMRSVVNDLHEKVAKIAEGGGLDARNKHTGRGKLLPRDRVLALERLEVGAQFRG